MKIRQIGNATLYLADCREVAGELVADAVVSDPPYGIGMKWAEAKRIGRKSGLAFAGSADRQPEWKDIHGDTEPFDPAPWLRYSEVILWGANNYASRLPDSRGWLIWDKRRDTTPDDHGDAEMAWTSLDRVIRVHRQVWRGIVREGSENVANGPKHHPTQKPIELMRWCVAMTSGTVLDPYMGSGSTGVACMDLQRPFVGVEIDPGYYEVACKRIEDAQRQARLIA